MTATAGNWIGGDWRTAHGQAHVSTDPATGQTVWEGRESDASDIDRAFASARGALRSWAAQTLESRIQICREFASQVEQDKQRFAELISQETGKPVWEATTEVAAVIGKVGLAVDAIEQRRWTSEVAMSGARAVLRYKPYGVMVVLGPFNLPAHLPNGHIVPALLAGNTVVFKPSEMTPAVGQLMMEKWAATSLPAGVINLVQGGRQTGSELIEHEQLDGLLFTGSSNAGIHFLERFATRPEKILALEMGGNNPLVVDSVSDNRAAAYETVLSAYITAGQRCTCARRLIVIDGAATEAFLSELESMIGRIRVGPASDRPEPFVASLISKQHADFMIDRQAELVAQGGTAIVSMKRHATCETVLSPGLIDVTAIENRDDHEAFGPLLQVIRVRDFEAAIEEANRTRYGLAAGLISDDASRYEQFLFGSRAGIVNWNRQTTGASGKFPFGGIGRSGNHRPSGYFACDYCSYPVASIEIDQLQLPATALTGIEL